MNITKTIFSLIVLIILSIPASAQRSEYFPLTEGTTWTYKGTVKWTESGNKTRERKISWTMTVEKRAKNGQFEIALMKGNPSDLCWYEPDRKPGRYLIVWKDNKYYEVRINNDLDKLLTDEAYLASKTGFNSIFLVEPLKKNMEFGNDPEMKRDDTFYEWLVEEEKSGSLSTIKGIPKQSKVQKYTLIYRTMPDHQIVEFVPNVGITKYVYQHHGTVSEVDVRLTNVKKK